MRAASSLPPESSRASTAWVWATPGRTRIWLAVNRSATASGAGVRPHQQFEIGLEHAAQAGRAVAAVDIGGDDLAEQGERRLGPAGARIIAGQPPLGAHQRRGARIVAQQQGDRDLVLALGLGLVAARLGEAGKLAMDLGAQPDGRGDAAAADRDQLGRAPG